MDLICKHLPAAVKASIPGRFGRTSRCLVDVDEEFVDCCHALTGRSYCKPVRAGLASGYEIEDYGLDSFDDYDGDVGSVRCCSPDADLQRVRSHSNSPASTSAIRYCSGRALSNRPGCRWYCRFPCSSLRFPILQG